MKVKELIEELKKLDPEMIVLGSQWYDVEYADLSPFGIRKIKGYLDGHNFTFKPTTEEEKEFIFFDCNREKLKDEE